MAFDIIIISIHGGSNGAFGSLLVIVLWVIFATIRIRVYWVWAPIVLVVSFYMHEWVRLGLVREDNVIWGELVFHPYIIFVFIAGLLGWIAAFGWARSAQMAFTLPAKNLDSSP